MALGCSSMGLLYNLLVTGHFLGLAA